MPDTDAYDRFAIFDPISPIDPCFMQESVRAIMRSLPLQTGEPDAWVNRRMHACLIGLAAMNPRDEIEVMIGVQATCAYNAACANWHLGMNHGGLPRGNNHRNFATAAAAARTFDMMLRALERRQAKPLGVPPGRPAPRAWPEPRSRDVIADLEVRIRMAPAPTPEPDPDDPDLQWTPQQLAEVEAMVAQAQFDKDHAGLDLANTEGILPGGGMIMPEHPTPQQEAYMARRLGNEVRRIYAANIAKGMSHRQALPKIRHIRPGMLIE
jgi:hypothetical protein